MYDTTLPRCPGAVVVHRDMALTCTSDFCQWDLPRPTWYGLHANFVRCVDAIGGSGCPHCGFQVSPGPHSVLQVNEEQVQVANEITSIEWSQHDQRVLLHYDVGEVDSLLATNEVAAELADQAGMEVVPGDDATVRWVRADPAATRRRSPSTGSSHVIEGVHPDE